MKRKFKILEILFFIIFFHSIGYNQPHALDTNSIKFFPLKVGNTYNYLKESTFGLNHYSTIIKSEIIKDSLINNKLYYYCKNFPYIEFWATNSTQNLWIRTDSITGSLYSFYPENSCFYFFEQMLDSLSASLSDTNRYCKEHNFGFLRCSLIDSIDLFNINSHRKVFYEFYSGPGIFLIDRAYCKNFGISSARYMEQLYFPTPVNRIIKFNLLGCVINGVVYGDTTMTKIQNISNTIPESYYLYQNYPNPFNPTTNIKFDIPKSSFTKLSVYNSEGKLINTLYNGNLRQGSYEMDFDGGSFPSGVYFYKLETNEFTISKKMLLLK